MKNIYKIVLLTGSVLTSVYAMEHTKLDELEASAAIKFVTTQFKLNQPAFQGYIYNLESKENAADKNKFCEIFKSNENEITAAYPKQVKDREAKMNIDNFKKSDQYQRFLKDQQGATTKKLTDEQKNPFSASSSNQQQTI
ncbi:MAG: hypothetical protein ACTSXG_01395, partial [Alphaproteobacteria bacterium]